MASASFTPEYLKYLRLLSKQYPSRASLFTEIINLSAILNLPKGTEHFISDLHGEFESVEQILNNCSGVIREKIRLLWGDSTTHAQRSQLCTLIYYPHEKLRRLGAAGVTTDEWYRKTLWQLIELAKLLSSKHTRARVRRAMSDEFAFIIDELMHAQRDEDDNQQRYHEQIIETLIAIKSGKAFVIALCELIKNLAVEFLHVVGDVYDRGPRPDSIMDMLMKVDNIDIEWGNHDILWMGAASGSEACIAAVVRNSIAYRNMDVLERGYGISLRPLTVFAEKTYPHLDPVEAATQAISVIMFKLEGQLLRRHPEYELDEHLMLEKINLADSTIEIGTQTYPLSYRYPTVDPLAPYLLSPGEDEVINELKTAFAESQRLHHHISFFYEKGGMYRCFNGNLLFHGCIPMDEDGSFHTLIIDGQPVSGRALMDSADRMARRAYHRRDRDAQDFMWYLWCGEFSPLCGRKTTTFAHIYLRHIKEVLSEPRNPYYAHSQSAETCLRILKEFGLDESGHIVNGHTPVKVSSGESPVKADGKLFVIDGGFCRAIQKRTGIAGYTLISNSHGLRIMRHDPFTSLEEALKENRDIHSESQPVETYEKRLYVRDTDEGRMLQERIDDLNALLEAYRAGLI